jgi:hypothetical protein
MRQERRSTGSGADARHGYQYADELTYDSSHGLAHVHAYEDANRLFPMPIVSRATTTAWGASLKEQPPRDWSRINARVCGPEGIA